MSKLSISELEFYTLPELVEVYRTIDKENNPIKISVMEKQIRIKMNLSASADLSSESIQKQFDQILIDYAQVKHANDVKKKIVKKLRKVQLPFLLIFVIIGVLIFIYKDYSYLLAICFSADIGILSIIEVVQSRYSGQIYVFDKVSDPQSFEFMQALLLIFGIFMLFLVLVMIKR
ncbi:MAG: hypothetical protein ACM3Q2_04155 [Syntrophothermus sp.]